MFDIQRFSKKLDDQLNGRTVGYEYAIYQGEVLSASGAGGYADILAHTPMTANRRMTVASMSKTITATAFMRAIEILNAAGPTISLDSKISAYLPHGWDVKKVENITFRHLLLHTSGLRDAPDDHDRFNSLKHTIASGLTNFKTREYQNCNYSLLRILIPNMIYGVDKSEKNIFELAALDLSLSKRCFDFVRDKVLGPIGLGSVSLAPNGPGEAGKYYDFNNQSKVPYHDPDFNWHLLRFGAGHWFMSSIEFGRFIAGLSNGKIVSKASFEVMRSLDLGMYPDDSTIGGKNWNHSGGFDTTAFFTGGMTGAWVLLPNNITAVILANSFGGLKKSTEDVIRNAFNAACLTPPTTNAAPAATTFGNRIYVAIKSGENHLYINSAADRQPFDGWIEVEGKGTSAVAPAIATLGNRMYVLACGAGDQRIYINSALIGQPFDGFGFGWQPIADATTDVSVAAASLGNRIYVFAKGINDKKIYVNSGVERKAFDGWGKGWQSVPGLTSNVAPAAAALGNRIYVFAKSISDNRVYVNSAVNGQTFDGWGNGWQPVPGIASNASPAATTLGNRIYIFAKSLDQHIHVTSAADGQAFGKWKEVEGNGTTDMAPAAASLGGRIYVFARGITNKRIYVNSAVAGQPFDGWGRGWSEVHG